MITEDRIYQTITDSTDASNVYYGYADLGRATTDAKWRIKKKVTVGSVVTELYPIGTTKYPVDDFAFKWSERDHYNYSLVPDFTAPTLSTVTIASNNTTTRLAKVGDVVTLTIVSSEAINEPVVTLGAGSATIVAGADELHWTATRTMTSDDVNGVVTFSIAFSDKGGSVGTPVSAITGGSNVTFDKVAPTAAITYSVANPSHAGDTQVITATFSEPLKDSPVVKIALSGSNTVAATVMTKSTTQIYTYSHTVGAGNGDCTVSLSVGVDNAGNPIVATPTSGATFTIDNTAPYMLSAERISNTTLRVTLSENADDATLTQANDGGFIVYETGTPATTYAVSATAKNGSFSNQIDLTVATVLASAAVGVTITYATGGNALIADGEGNLMVTDATGVLIPAWA